MTEYPNYPVCFNPLASGRDDFVTIEVESNLEPGIYYPRIGRIMGRRTHGFNLAHSGGWGLMGGHPGDTPAEFLIFKPKGHRKLQAIAVERIKGMKPKPQRTQYEPSDEGEVD